MCIVLVVRGSIGEGGGDLCGGGFVGVGSGVGADVALSDLCSHSSLPVPLGPSTDKNNSNHAIMPPISTLHRTPPHTLLSSW